MNAPMSWEQRARAALIRSRFCGLLFRTEAGKHGWVKKVSRHLLPTDTGKISSCDNDLAEIQKFRNSEICWIHHSTNRQGLSNVFLDFCEVCIVQRGRLGVRLPANFMVRAARSLLRGSVLILLTSSQGVHWKDGEQSTAGLKKWNAPGRLTPVKQFGDVKITCLHPVRSTHSYPN